MKDSLNDTQLTSGTRGSNFWSVHTSISTVCANRERCAGHRAFAGSLYGPRHEKTFLLGFANNKGADQPDQRLCYSLFGKYHI